MKFIAVNSIFSKDFRIQFIHNITKFSNNYFINNNKDISFNFAFIVRMKFGNANFTAIIIFNISYKFSIRIKTFNISI